MSSLTTPHRLDRLQAPWLIWHVCRQGEDARELRLLGEASAAEGVYLVAAEDAHWTEALQMLPLAMIFDCSGGRASECAEWILTRLDETADDALPGVDRSCPQDQRAHSARVLREFGPSLPVAALLASTEVNDVARLMRAGVSEVFDKPVCTLRFRRWLRSLIAARQAAGAEVRSVHRSLLAP